MEGRLVIVIMCSILLIITHLFKCTCKVFLIQFLISFKIKRQGMIMDRNAHNAQLKFGSYLAIEGSYRGKSSF